MSRKQKKVLARILASAVLLVGVALACRLLPVPGWLAVLLYLVPYFVIGYDVLWDALRNILHGQVFDENFLMCIATVGAFALQDFNEAVFVMLFYQVGELFQSYAVGKSRRSIAELMDIRPDVANVERDGDVVEADPEEVAVGDVIVVRPGEKIPLDGVVLEGTSSVNTTALTGESVPRTLREGDTGSAVTNLQYTLYELGYYDADVDGVYGATTKDAVRAFQMRNNLSPVDGIAGNKTLQKLYSSSAVAAAASNNEFNTLQKGDKGDIVVQLQDCLVQLNYMSVKTGVYDDATVEAVKNFQRYNGLTVDGKAGAETQKKLFSDSAVAYPGP